MRKASLRLRAMGVRCSCRTTCERGILARVVPSRASSTGPTSSIPHGKSLLGGDCSFWCELSAAEVEGVAGFLERGFATQSIKMRGYILWGCSIVPTRVPAEDGVKVAALVEDTISIRAACLFYRPPGFVKEAVPLPGANLALVGCNAESCTLVGLFHVGIAGR